MLESRCWGVRMESRMSQTWPVHYPEKGWHWAREGEGQKRDSAVLGSLESDLRMEGEQSGLRVAGTHCLKRMNSLQLSQKRSLHFSGYTKACLPHHRRQGGSFRWWLAVTDLATWRSAGPTAGPFLLLLLHCSQPHLNRRQIVLAVPRKEI